MVLGCVLGVRRPLASTCAKFLRCDSRHRTPLLRHQKICSSTASHERDADIVVVGAGNAAMCAALSAREHAPDKKILVLERSDRNTCGGNSRFTAGAMRVAYNGVDDIRALVPDLTEEEVSNTDFGSYKSDDFYNDLVRVTQSRGSPELLSLLVDRSFDTLNWMHHWGSVRFCPIYGRQAFKVDGKFKFWGGLTLETYGGGPGLVEQQHSTALEKDIEVLYNSRATNLITDDDSNRIIGLRYRTTDGIRDIHTKAVVLAAGGFQANSRWRTQFLGPGWDLAKVRGTKNNVGDGIKMALDVDAESAGHWSGCHAVGWDMNAPAYGDLQVGDGFQKHSYPFGIMLNANGQRFVDEGADFRNYTYAKYGEVILRQPQQFAWQIFDAKVAHLLRDEYRIKQVTKVESDSVEDLVTKLDGVNAEQARATIYKFNASVDESKPFNPNVKDGRKAALEVPKSNWANKIDTPPFSAFQVTCGITFTFGGIKISERAQVLSTSEAPIPGLFAAGEMVGGIFYFNYAGGSGLTNGAVFGRIAGENAAKYIASL